MNGVTKFREKSTGEIKIAVYAHNRIGNLRYNIDGKFLSDKELDRKYTRVIEEDAAKDNLLKVVNSKRVVFIEYDDHLSEYGPEQVSDLFKKHDISYTICCSLYNNDGLAKAMVAIREADVIIFQTQWVRDISTKIRDLVFAMKESRVFVECYISKPSFYFWRDPIHEVYILSTHGKNYTSEEEPWEFYKLSKKPYWDYRNHFDK